MCLTQEMKSLQQQSLFNFQKLQQRLEAAPSLTTEESILLRILVQGLVTVGIIATDVAAQTQMSFWAVPLSIVGAAWSWHRRRKRNVMVKFLIALGMLLALVVFFGNLVESLNDTRVVLAQLLVQLQVLHSFDLPRRKDLGYSMVIGLILLGVAGTVSQTLAFAPFLLLFLALAIPVLILDYRSRLGFEESEDSFFSRSSSQRKVRRKNKLGKYSPLSPKRLGVILLMIVALGLTLFIFMPRVPGYQLQSFPVSAPSEIENATFDAENGGGIANPGYVREGIGGGGSPTQGAGEMDDTFYSGFSGQMNQNLRGQMTPKVVLRVRSQAPGFWRVLAFDRYTGQGWEISREDQQQTLQRSPWSYQFFLNRPFSAAETKSIVQSYTAVADLPNIIPALSHPSRLYFPTREVAVDPEGALRSPQGLVNGLTYTVVSQVPLRDRTQLRQASEEYSETIERYYLQVPPEILDEVREQTEALLTRSEQPITSAYEKTLFLTQALKQNYEIREELPFFAEDEDLVTAFLSTYQGGYPDHFSATLTIMLRSIGIPARLATGFAPGQFNPFTGLYIVRNTDAFALTEVYFPNYGWFAFDPIPGHEVLPPSWEESQTFSVLRQFWNWIAGWLPSPVTNFVGAIWNFLVRQLAQAFTGIWQFFTSGAIGLILGVITLVTISFAIWLVWSQAKIWQNQRRMARLSPMERLYQQMLTLLAAKGYSKHPAQTPLEYARGIQQTFQRSVAEIIEEISEAYVNWRYGGHSPNLASLQQQLQLLTKHLQKP